MDIRLDGKRALVTGAGKGIGRDIARLLVACGATVVGVSRSPADVASLQRELDVEGIVADLTHADAAREAARGPVRLTSSSITRVSPSHSPSWTQPSRRSTRRWPLTCAPP